uniref:Putative autophagy-related protein 8E n=2 Tax=Oryza TaxID=4527 RepID=ATG8E_ORYSJ|nr:RecName: Full=Putative autophagy-related protein 8E; AltName: Full=Autophagy-related ubiquitin-like modifier ATG8E [Oryza sativa Japonica Group]
MEERRKEKGKEGRRGKATGHSVDKFSRSNLPEMEKRKLHLPPGTALFVFVNNTLPQTAQLMGSVYESYKDEGDGFLYLCYSSEKTFG